MDARIKKILIIDDEPLIRQSFLYVSKVRGYSAQAVGMAQEGLTIWRSWLPDLVFLDLILPDHNGLALLENASQFMVKMACGNKPAKVVLMSAYSQYSRKAKKKGADLFLTKPFENIFQTFDQVISHFQELQLEL